jgi:hypothetical protein
LEVVRKGTDYLQNMILLLRRSYSRVTVLDALRIDIDIAAN